MIAANHDHINRVPRAVIFYGGTGQAKVLRPIVEHYGGKVVAVIDDTSGLSSPFRDVPIFHGYDAIQHWLESQDRSQLGFCIAIGNPHGRVRVRLHQRLLAEGLQPVTLAHATAFIDRDVEIGAGCQIMAGAIIGTESRIGIQCIVNTRASIDHECVLEDGCEVAPGATLCGIVHMEEGAWVGAGATVLPRLRIGAGAIIGGGALVNRDVPSGSKVVGIPARSM